MNTTGKWAIALLILASQTAMAQMVSDLREVPNPDDLEVDRFGNLWVNYREGSTPDVWHLARLSPDGTFTNVITRDHELGMFGINDSIIWITGPWSEGVVLKFNHNAEQLDTINLQAPTAIILDPDGTWYITQNALGRLTKVFPDKTRQILAAGAPLSFNLALARDENGIFYTCNLMNGRVIRIDPTTGQKTILASLPTSSPYSLGFLGYHAGHLYVPSFKNCIYKVDTAGTGHSVFAGIEGTSGYTNGSVDTALIFGPTSVAFSLTGDTLYFTDAGNHRIRMVTGVNSSVSVDELGHRSDVMQLFPNPAGDHITLRPVNAKLDIALIEIIAADGRIVDSLRPAAIQETYTLPLGKTPSGLNTVRLTTSSGRWFIKQFIRL